MRQQKEWQRSLAECAIDLQGTRRTSTIPRANPRGEAAMTACSVVAAPHVQFFSGRQETFLQSGDTWRRATPEDSAKMHTGLDRESREPNVGVYIVHKPNDLVRVGFDLWKIDANLRPSVLERLESRWQEREAVNLSKSMLRRVGRRMHISKSFARFEISLHRLEKWKAELSAILSNSESYEQL
jgi:hypothetical protein